MKKIALTVLIIVLATLTSFSSAFASQEVTETPNVKVVIEAAPAAFEKTPVIINGRTMLPFREVLNKLGVPDDEQHIKWNPEDKSISVNCEIGGQTKTVFMQIDNNTATLNGNSETMDVAPVIYKDSTYIPVRFVAQALGKTVVWDGSTTTVLIRDTVAFEQVKDILAKSAEARKAKHLMKTNTDMDMNMTATGDTLPEPTGMRFKVKQSTEADTANMVFHINQTMNNPIPNATGDITTDIYLSDGVMYMQNPMNNQWMKSSLNKEMFDKMLEGSNSANFEMTDTICAGLSLDAGAPEGKYLLKGTVYIKELFDSMLSDYKLPMADLKIDFKDYYIELLIDKNTMLPENEKIKLGVSMDAGAQGTMEMNMSGDIAITFDDTIKIAIPEEALAAADMSAGLDAQ